MAGRTTDDWGACPAGALQQAALRGRRRNRLRWAMAGCAVVGALSLALFLSARPKEAPTIRHPIDVEYNYGGIACSQVISNLSDFVDHKLDAATESRLDEHLRECAKCRTRLEQMSSASASAGPDRLRSASTRFGDGR